jgi:hypothetical protein
MLFVPDYTYREPVEEVEDIFAVAKFGESCAETCHSLTALAEVVAS